MINASSTINWGAVTNVTGYEVGVTGQNDNLNSGGSLLASAAVGQVTSVSAGTVFGSLAPGLYKIQVRTTGPLSAWSDGVQGTDFLIVDWQPTTPPTNLSIT